MINDLRLPNDPLEDMLKYADETTISEAVPMSDNTARTCVRMIEINYIYIQLNVKKRGFNFLNVNT